MPINLYSIEELNSIGNAAVKTNLPELDPTIEGSWIRALVSSNSILIYAAQRNIEAALNDFFPQTASGEFLDFWAEINALTRVIGTVSEGFAVLTGTLSTTIPSGTLFASSDSNIYISTSATTIAAQTGSVSLSAVGATITATTPVIHNLVDGLSTTISGATDTDYNGTFSINVLDEYTFQYTALSAPAASTDSGSYSAEFANIPLESQEVGADKNLSHGAVLTLQSTVVGVDSGSQATVNRDGLTGGSDLESDESLRERVLLANSIDAGVFTNAQLRLDALTIPTCTRVFITNPTINYTTDGTDVSSRSVDGATFSGGTVTLDMTTNGTANIYAGSTVTVAGANEADYNGEHTIVNVTSTSLTYAISGSPSSPATGTITISLDKLKNIPQPGSVYVFVLDDNNNPPTPSSTTITNVRDKILEDLPAHMAADNLVVSGPFFESVDITITGLSPDSSSMRTAVEDALGAFFEDNADFSEDIKVNKLIAAIQNTQDAETGLYVDDFTLTAPTSDVSVGEGTIGTLGTVTFA